VSLLQSPRPPSSPLPAGRTCLLAVHLIYNCLLYNLYFVYLRFRSKMTALNTIRLLNTSEGHALAREILRERLPYDPHGYQIEGVCQAFDGVHLVGR
jgi:hypothetical protein